MNTDADAIIEKAETLCLLAVSDPVWLSEYTAAHKAAQSLEHSGWKRKTGMTQNSIILKHIRKAGSITVREAIVEYSIQSLTKRIQELRQAGYDIVSHVKSHPVTGQKYTRYSFAHESDYYEAAV